MLQGRSKKNGITLIALIITIVILLILSAVTIAEVQETKLFGKAKDGVNQYKKAQEDEQKQINTLVGQVDKWTEGLPKPRTEVPNDLHIGDYVKYNILYTDVRKTDTHFTEENGWRVINPGKKYSDDTYDGVEIISTGIPIRLYYHYQKIGPADGNTKYPWKGTEEDIKNFKNTCSYVAKDDRKPGVTAAAGLKYHFDKVNILESDPGIDSGYETGNGWRVKISKKINEEIKEVKGSQDIRTLLEIPGLVKEKKGKEYGVRCPDLEIVKGTMNKRQTEGGRVFDITTDKDVVYNNEDKRHLYKTKDDAAKGFWNLQDLGIGEYQPGKGGFSYWIASPYLPDGDCLRVMGCSGADEHFGYSNGAYSNGLRPIVSLKSNIVLEKSNFQGN